MAKKLNFRLLAIIFSLLLVVSFLPTKNAKAESEEVEIVVYSCEDYIDEELLDLFNEEYAGQYRVNYQTLATPEDMYNELSRNPKGIQLVCPSEYMIMKMMTEGLIKPFDVPENMKEFNSPYIKSVFQNLTVNVNGTKTPILSSDMSKTYAVGYMWGTMGYVYNMNEFSVEDLKNWDAILYNGDCVGKTTIKDSVRDTYIMAVGAVYKDELLALDKNAPDYNQKLTEIFNRTDDETIAKVEEYLQKLRVNLYGFEVDSGKDDILQGKITVNFAWSGDAVYAMDEGDLAEVELGYAVPEEGSNVWFDGFVMSKYCEGKYEEGAIAFLDFLSNPENAIANMEYTGYTSVVGGDEVFDSAKSNYGVATLIESAITFAEYQELDKEKKEEYVIIENVVYEYEYADYLVASNGDKFKALVKVYNEETETIEEVEVEVFEVDLSYFFGEDKDYKVYTDTLGRQFYAQYSDYDTISRCAVMDNFSKEDLEKIDNMWSRVKLSTLSTTAIILIVVLLILVILVVLFIRYREKVMAWSFIEKLKPKKKSKYQVVKVEYIDPMKKKK